VREALERAAAERTSEAVRALLDHRLRRLERRLAGLGS
jgi:hypothetical protein